MWMTLIIFGVASGTPFRVVWSAVCAAAREFDKNVHISQNDIHNNNISPRVGHFLSASQSELAIFQIEFIMYLFAAARK